MSNYFKLFGIISLVLVASIAIAVSTVNLQYNLKTGDVVKYEMVMTGTAETTMKSNDPMMAVPSEPQNMTMNYTLGFTQKVTNISQDGILTVDVSFDEVNMIVKTAGQEIKTPVADILKGKTLSMQMNKKGKVIEIKGLDELMKAGGQSMNLDQMMSQMSPLFPEGEIKEGDTWKQKLDTPIQTTTGMNITNNGEVIYTFKGFETKNNYKCAKIEMVMTLEQKISSSQMGFTMSGTTNATGKGVMFFANDEGKVILSDMDTKIISNVKMEGTTDNEGNKSTMDTTVKMDMKTVMNLK